MLSYSNFSPSIILFDLYSSTCSIYCLPSCRLILGTFYSGSSFHSDLAPSIFSLLSSALKLHSLAMAAFVYSLLIIIIYCIPLYTLLLSLPSSLYLFFSLLFISLSLSIYSSTKYFLLYFSLSLTISLTLSLSFNVSRRFTLSRLRARLFLLLTSRKEINSPLLEYKKGTIYPFHEPIE